LSCSDSEGRESKDQGRELQWDTDVGIEGGC
jgi:hypothetical protein